jgi:hypothetical protein
MGLKLHTYKRQIETERTELGHALRDVTYATSQIERDLNDLPSNADARRLAGATADVVRRTASLAALINAAALLGDDS